MLVFGAYNFKDRRPKLGNRICATYSAELTSIGGLTVLFFFCHKFSAFNVLILSDIMELQWSDRTPLSTSLPRLNIVPLQDWCGS